MYQAFSAGLLGFPGRTLRESAPLAAQNGYEGVDFDVETESAGDPLELRELLEENRLKNAGFGLPVEFRKGADAFEADMKRLPSLCAFAQKMGADRCTTWLLPSSESLPYRENFGLHRQRLGRAAGVLADHGIRLGVEFVGPPSMRKGKPYAFIHNLDGLIELLLAIGAPNLGILMDAWHWDMAGQSREDFKKIPGKEWVVLAHINDAPAGKKIEEQQDQVRELPGATGVLRIHDFFQGLAELSYDGPVLAEPFNAPLKAMPLGAAAAAAKAAMDKVWPPREPGQ